MTGNLEAATGRGSGSATTMVFGAGDRMKCEYQMGKWCGFIKYRYSEGKPAQIPRTKSLATNLWCAVSKRHTPWKKNAEKFIL